MSASFEWVHLGLGLFFPLPWLGATLATLLLFLNFVCGPESSFTFHGFFIKIVQSSLHLTKLILHPALPIDPQLISVESKLNHHAAVVLLGNSITLTPGTITVEVDRNNLMVHALDKVLCEDVESRQIESKIADIFKDEDPDL